MTYHNNTLCISYSELVNKQVAPNVVGDGAFISQYDYLNYSKSKKLKAVRRGCRGTEALYDFEQLPIELKNAVAKKYTDIVKTAQQEPLKQVLVNDYKAYSFFCNYTHPNGEHLKENTIREYTATASALNAIITLLNDSKAWRKALGGSGTSKGSLKNLIEILGTLENKWGWKLPNSERGVRYKLTAYKAQGYAALISGKLCNENAAKATSDNESEALLRRLISQFNNLDNAQVTKLFNLSANVAGWKNISAKTVGNYRDKWQIYVDAGSRGKSHHENTHAMQVRRSAPTAPLIYWTVDGWDAELLYQKQEIDKKGTTRTTYHNRPTIVVVLDPCQKYPIGYAIGTHETPELIRQAMRNAVRHTAELFGSFYHVHQLQTDRYGKGTLTPFYEAIAEKYTPARAHNAKAKVIEPFFKYLNKEYCQLKNNWSGVGITSRKEVQPNTEYKNKIRHSFPDFNGVVAQLDEMIRLDRLSKVEAYMKAWNSLADTHKLSWTHEEFLLNIGESTDRTNRLEGQGLKKTIDGQSFFYESFDTSFRKHRNVDWLIKYDPAHMDEVLAVSKDKSLRYMLTEQYLQPMALFDRKDGDSDQLKRIGDYNEDLIEDILSVQDEDYRAIEGLISKNPELATLSKLLIVDSKGQHKNNKSNARLIETAQRIEIKEAKKVERKQIAEAEDERDAYINEKININDYL